MQATIGDTSLQGIKGPRRFFVLLEGFPSWQKLPAGFGRNRHGEVISADVATRAEAEELAERTMGKAIIRGTVQIDRSEMGGWDWQLFNSATGQRVKLAHTGTREQAEKDAETAKFYFEQTIKG